MSSRTKKKPPGFKSLGRLPLGAVLSWTDLDPFLDGSAEAFGKDLKKLHRALKKIDAQIVLPSGGEEARCYDAPYEPQSSLRSDGLKPYERELAAYRRLNRIGEFLMARRHEFAKLRARSSLELAGFAPERLDKMLLLANPNLLDWPAKTRRSPKLREQAELRIHEYNELRNSFLNSTLYIVMHAVHKYRSLGIDTSDLIQEGNISLFQAIEGFDWRRSVRFKTYAEYWVNQAFLKMLYNNVRTVRVPVWVQKLLKKIKDLQARAVMQTGEELSFEEVGKRLGIPASKVRDLLKTRRYAVSLDQKLGNDEDAVRLVDLIEDEQALPVPDQVVDVPLSARLGEVMEGLPDREREILELRYGLGGRSPKTLREIGDLFKVSAERVRQLQEVALAKLKLPRIQKRLQAFSV